MSKGDWYRPVNQKKYAANYDRIWGKCDRVNPKNESCKFCKRNPAAVEVQTRFFCPERGEPLDE